MADRWFLMRPVPAFFSQRDLREWVTLDDVLDAHEKMDLEQAAMDKAMER